MLTEEPVTLLFVDDTELFRVSWAYFDGFSLLYLYIFFGFSSSLMLIAVQDSILDREEQLCLLDLYGLCECFESELQSTANPAHYVSENVRICISI